jgi:YVTN family beta-propeller protein
VNQPPGRFRRPGAPAARRPGNTSSTLSVIDVARNAVKATVDLGLSEEPTEIALV